MDGLSRKGLEGWEIYQILKEENVVHFFMKREISKEEILNKRLAKFPIGFVE